MTFRRRIAAAACAVALAASPATASGQGSKDQPSVAGTWSVTVKGTGAHGDMGATMALNQSGDKVTGTFSAHGNEHTVAGTFIKGRLELSAPDMPEEQRLMLSAKLLADGTLAGSLSGPVSDAKWTATRVREKQ